ncbi:MAG: GTPase HflX [Candidatus Cloacimonetes bacterium]|nr:GTPase HflX [Candidatus Cloacimonadota bacterium]HOH59795.1 GTPase HflX [Candidatus Cloacimonadota bacterium]HPI25934.1 GTPase HflX [Candidatus Cloacimonadota bacterium]
MSQDFIMEEYELEEEWEELEEEEKSAFIATLIRQGKSADDSEASLDELERLADTAGIIVLGRYSQKRPQPERATYFGKGFLEELSAKFFGAKADVLIINEELSPMQGRNIEKQYGIRVIDRTELILSIFHQHARTKEAKLQVKLAELQYQLPRLKKLWGHFDKERGSVRSAGGAATRGMGEKQIEIDKRLIRSNIRKINSAIDSITRHKETQRKQRDNTGKLCLVGYTNAGKSTLFNRLTDAGVLVEDRLFATLDSTSRQLKLSTGNPVVISDTVGFISDLPHHLVASFRATLMEAMDADLLLHVVDISDPRHEHYISEVNDVLSSIGAEGIEQILVLNKCDALDERMQKLLERYFEDGIFISAVQGTGVTDLIQAIEVRLLKNQSYRLKLPYAQTALVSRLHEIGKIEAEDYREDGIYLTVTIAAKDQHLIQPYCIEGENH